MRFYLSLLGTSLRASVSNRATFLLEAGLMLANNLIFLILWWILFRQFQTIGGWDFKDMIALMAIVSGAVGIMMVFAGGTRFLSRYISSGDLDSFMTQPKSVLLHLIGSRSNARGWGDILTMFIMIAIGGFTSPATLSLILIGAICGSMVFCSMAIIANSFSFWMGSIENLAKQYCDSLVVFSFYPQTIYTGVFKIFMFTVIPAGVIGLMPVELIQNFTWFRLATLFVTTAIFCWCASIVFHLGLRRYESGNQFGARV